MSPRRLHYVVRDQRHEAAEAQKTLCGEFAILTHRADKPKAVTCKRCQKRLTYWQPRKIEQRAQQSRNTLARLAAKRRRKP